MRTLGIETSGPRGSVALVEGDRVVAAGHHAVPSGHAEQLLPLIERALADAGWPRTALDRVAVGVGPGSFTGLRVGIALGQGLALGLDRPAVGVGSLHALAAAARRPEDAPDALVVAVTDARRDELFVAALGPGDVEALEPTLVPRGAGGGAWLVAMLRRLGRARAVWVGEALGPLVAGEPAAGAADAGPGAIEPGAVELPDGAGPWRRGAALAGPDAGWVARLGATLTPALAPPEPRYVREADAVLPRLPPSPFGRVV